MESSVHASLFVHVILLLSNYCGLQISQSWAQYHNGAIGFLSLCSEWMSSVGLYIPMRKLLDVGKNLKDLQVVGNPNYSMLYHVYTKRSKYSLTNGLAKF